MARAEGWLKVMRLDVFTSWIVCTLCTLSRMYTDTMGPWAQSSS
ncbi:hypothetical protein [Nonomuraea sp. NPDC050643]